MMNLSYNAPLFLAAVAVVLPSAALRANEQVTAFEALDRVAEFHGERFTESIVEMRGERGQPQPREWWMVVRDRRSRTTIRTLWADKRRSTNEGANEDFYPLHIPEGFIARGRLRVGSVEAFKVADREATKVGIGFDSLQYHLRAREFSDQPIWWVTLLNSSKRPVGQVAIAADTGAVLRTVWYLRKSRSAEPGVRDSAIPGQNPSPLTTPPNNSPGNTVPPPPPPTHAPVPPDFHPPTQPLPPAPAGGERERSGGVGTETSPGIQPNIPGTEVPVVTPLPPPTQ